ncbi:MAG TPA: chromate transporter [Dongiaceae bacterium]|nr:chromate transporter [Dongiaceae bacterium]
MRNNIYWQLIAVFAPLSLISLGGGQSVIADMNKQVVDFHGWMSQADFVDLFAISRAAPGPGSLLVTLIGWKVAGLPGAVVASLALFLPAAVLAFFAARLWNRHQGHTWHRACQRGLAPIATGLLLASAFAVLRSTSGEVSLWVIALAAAAIFILRPGLNPLLVLGSAGVVEMSLQAFLR